MISSIKVGSAWVHKVTNDTIIICSANRTGHQYDRFWLLEGMTKTGQIIEIEDYLLASAYKLIEDKDSDTSTI